MKKNARIYVAGHRGLVGSAILRKLRDQGYGNIILRKHEALDLKNQLEVQRFFDKEEPEYVILAAAKVGGIWANDTYPAQFVYDNLMIQSNIIHSSYLHEVKKLLFLGSSCIYPKDCPQPMREEHLLSGYLEPTNEAYAIAKIVGIKMCQAYNRQYGTNYISVMPTNLYGPNDNFDLQTSHVLPALIRKFHLAKMAAGKHHKAIQADELQHGPIPGEFKKVLGIDPDTNRLLSDTTSRPTVTIWGTGKPRREFLHVEDLADACVHLMKEYDQPDIINVGTGKDIAIQDLAELIAKIIGFKGEVFFDTSKPDGVGVKLLDVSKLNGLGWNALISLEEGIRKTYEWYLKQ
jgi:GDP-L-fucose synthase